MKKNILAFRFCFVSLNVIPPENFMAYKISKKKKKEKNPHKFNFHHEINVIILIEIQSNEFNELKEAGKSVRGLRVQIKGRQRCDWRENSSWRTNHEILSAGATSVTVRSFDVCLSVVDFRVKRADGSVARRFNGEATRHFPGQRGGCHLKNSKATRGNPLKERSNMYKFQAEKNGAKCRGRIIIEEKFSFILPE